MKHAGADHDIHTTEALEALLGEVNIASRKKEISFIHEVYRPFVEASSFAVLATSGPEGLNASPRGDGPGFARVFNEKTLLMTERRGMLRDTTAHLTHANARPCTDSRGHIVSSVEKSP